MLLSDLGRICTNAGRLMLDAVLPPLCLGCGEIVEAPGALCAACWQGFSFISPPQCACCGDPFAEHLGDEALCAGCLARRAALSPGPRGAGLRHPEPPAGAAVQAWRPHRHRPRLRRLDGAGRRRSAGRGRPDRAGAAPLAPAVHAPLQSGAAAGPRSSVRTDGAGGASAAWPPICCAGAAGRARRPVSRPRSGGATSARPSTSIRAGRRRSRARPCCWSTTC